MMNVRRLSGLPTLTLEKVQTKIQEIKKQEELMHNPEEVDNMVSTKF